MPETGDSTNNHQAFLRLDELSRDPRLRVEEKDVAAIAGQIIDSALYPYLLKKPQEEQERFQQQYVQHQSMLCNYCLQQYLKPPHASLTIDFIKGLHRKLYHDSAMVMVKGVDGTKQVMVPGEFSHTPVYIRKEKGGSDYFVSSAPETMEEELLLLVEALEGSSGPLFERYLRFLVDFSMIHPFMDSNGTISYMLGDLFLLKNGLHPPFFARCKWENEDAFLRLLVVFRQQSKKEIALFYPALLRAWEATLQSLIAFSPQSPGFGSAMPDSLFKQLMQQAREALERGDMPVAALCTVGNASVAASSNQVHSRNGRRFHAEQLLINSIADRNLPSGRRVLWVTHEPCKRCAQAIIRFGADEVVYLLDDPFGGGKALLQQAGIDVIRKQGGVGDCLGLMMEWFQRYPEFCSWQQYPYYRNSLWSLTTCTAEEKIRSVFRQHLSPYFLDAMNCADSPGLKDELRARFAQELESLTCFASAVYGSLLTADFVLELHNRLFVATRLYYFVTKKQEAQIPPEWSRFRQIPLQQQYRMQRYAELAEIEASLVRLLKRSDEPQGFNRGSAVRFIIDFDSISPFSDGNWVTAALMADIICIKHGEQPVAFFQRHPLLRTALLESAFIDGAPDASLLNLLDGFNQGRLTLKPYNIYDQYPEAFITYVSRSRQKESLSERVIAHLAAKESDMPLVIADIGAGLGQIADAVVSWLQQAGRLFKYHFVEPSATSVAYYKRYFSSSAHPDMAIHNLAFEEFLLPQSDLIIVSQTLQQIADIKELLVELLSTLKPDGAVLLVISHPESTEWQMTQRTTNRKNLGYFPLKQVLDDMAAEYEELELYTPVQISRADEGTKVGDDLLTFYFNVPAATLLPSVKQAFWQGLESFAVDGAVIKKKKPCFGSEITPGVLQLLLRSPPPSSVS